MHQSVDVLPVEDERFVLDEDFNFDIPCEGPRSWPEALGNCTSAAKWIGLKDCGHHRLFCGECKEFYLDRMAVTPLFKCVVCETLCTFYGFELINRARS